MRDVLAVILILAVPFNIAAAGLLVRLSRKYPSIQTLSMHAEIQVILMACSVIGGIFGLDHLARITPSSDLTTILTGLLLILVSIPAVRWLWFYYSPGKNLPKD